MLSPLRPGAAIALIAPSSPFEKKKLSQTCEMLKGAGYDPVLGEHVFHNNGYVAGTEAERAQDIIWAISDPAIQAIFCIRGGYGSGRLLPWLPFADLRRTPKIFLGYSDITFLHLAFWNKMHWPTFHGPNILEICNSIQTLEQIVESLSGKSSFSWGYDDTRIIRQGTASGVLIGGNLTCLVHLIGTPFFPDLTGALLLIEDRGEPLYRLDRLFMHLRLAGVLQNLGALILGNFKDCGGAKEVENMIGEQVNAFDFPVVADLPFGHCNGNQVIPLGIPFSLNTYEKRLQALQHPFGEE